MMMALKYSQLEVKLTFVACRNLLNSDLSTGDIKIPGFIPQLEAVFPGDRSMGDCVDLPQVAGWKSPQIPSLYINFSVNIIMG